MRPLSPGSVVAERFEIERPARSGGMGAVFRARDRQGGARVALKLLLGAEGTPEDARFRREARILAPLEHPGIVRFIDHGRTPEGMAWLAMEWLEGEDLSERLDRGRLTPAEAAALGLRVAEALAAAHARGVVHRDVKPSNLFLPGHALDRVKVIDFGIAHGFAEIGATVTGGVVGTPSYMAPEQARGEPDVDLRADLFSLGCVLFECLAGRPPFTGEHAMAVLAKILFEEPPGLAGLAPGIPPALAELVARLLEKNPEARPPDASAVAAWIAEAAEEAGAAPAPRPVAAITGREQRLVSVIVARAPGHPEAATLTLGGPDEDVAPLRFAVAPFRAQIETLADRSRVVVVAGDAGATDQAARAARCALALRDVLDGPLALATGRGIVERALPFGDVVDRAVALLRGAPPRSGLVGGPILVDEVTAGLLDRRFDVSADRRELRGEIDSPATAVPARVLLGKPTPLVGRDRELASLEAIFAECAAEGVARAALVIGPSGAGKSRLGHELLARLAGRDDAPAVWITRGDPLGTGSSWRLLARLCEHAAGITADDAPPVRRDKLLSHAGETRDTVRVAEFLGELIGAPFPDEGSVQLRAARQDARLLADQIRRAAEDLLGAACARGPVVVFVDDLHDADPASVAFLTAALRSLSERPLMVLALARPEVRERFPRLGAEGGAQEIRLGDLSRKAGERLVRHVLGDRATPEVAYRLAAQAAGNAFYLEELIRAEAQGQGGAVPGTVLAMVQARLASLSAEARRVLRAGSVFGEAFWRGGVRALLGDAGPDPGRALAELMDHELVVERRESRFAGEEEHAFRHAIVREAAYQTLTDHDRTAGHALAGAWLEQAGERDPMVLAEQFERGALPLRAALWLRHAAEQSHEAADLPAVIAHARRAGELGATGEILGVALLLRGEAHLWRGELTDADPCLTDAMRLTPYASPHWFRAAAGASWAASAAGASDRIAAIAVDVGRALAVTRSEAGVVAAARVSINLLGVGLPAAARPLLDHLSAAMEGPAVDPLAAAHVEELRAWEVSLSGDQVASTIVWSAVAARYVALGDRRQAVNALHNSGCAFLWAGRLEQGEAALRATVADCDRFGFHATLAFARSNLGMALLHRGAFPEALAEEELALAAAREQGERALEHTCLCYLAAVHLRRGDLPAAEAAIAQAANGVELNPSVRCLVFTTRAGIDLAAGRAHEALHAAREAAKTFAEPGSVMEGEAQARLALAEALHATGAVEEARAAIAVARARILEPAARITDPAWRTSFLEAIPEHARTLALAEAWGVVGGG